MNIMVQSTLITGVVFVSNTICRQRHKVINYLILFLLLTGIFYLFPSRAEGALFVPNAQIECDALKHLLTSECKLNPKEYAYYAEKVNFHQENAKRTYNDAKEKCWWLPSTDDRTKARYCFTSLMATIPASTPMSKMVASLVTFLSSYGIDCLEEWSYIQNKLYWSQYHYEMVEFYSNVLVKG